jgi:glycerophosphoryl diester phosphodiesterase
MERVAHRGAPHELLENTLPSFARALERGADAIELDAHVTSDGVVVVHHDNDVGGRAIRSTAWADLAQVPLRDGGRVPRLADVLELVRERATVYIELKGDGVGLPAVEVARRFGRRYAMHSFDHAAVAQVAQAAPDVARGVLIDEGTREAAQAMRSAVAMAQARDVWPHWSLVDAAFMDAANDLGVRVLVWTVNSSDAARTLRQAGVAGVCTDDVRLLANL